LNLIEIIAVIFGLICVWLTIRQNILCWPAGIIQVTLYFIIFLKTRLYADMGLQGIYFLLQFYGWYEWLHGGVDRGKLAVSNIKSRPALVLLALGIIITPVMGHSLTNVDANMPYLDSTTTVLSLIAQYMLAKKYLENWLVWITVNLLLIGKYLAANLFATSGLYVVFLFMALAGFLEWKKTLNQTQPA
jgi:nicotinamide mononucleotide transporter